MIQTGDGAAELCFPELNASCRKPSPPWTEAVLTNGLLSAVSAVTVALNLLVIVSISHFRQLHTPTNILLLSLAVSDFLVGLVVLPVEILLSTSCWLLGDLACSLYHYVPFVVTCTSVGYMVLISADRYVAICDPLRYAARVTVRRVRLCVCMCWFCSALFIALFSEVDPAQVRAQNSCRGECAVVIGGVATLVDLAVSFVVPVAAIVALYANVFAVAVAQARAVRSHVAAGSRRSAAATKKSELKAARTLGVLVVTFLVCYCPLYAVSLARDSSFNRATSYYLLYLVYLNSCLNPIIYVLYYPWFRRVLKLIITLRILRPGSREANVL